MPRIKLRKKKIFFLGYDQKKTKLIKFLKDKNFLVLQVKQKSLTTVSHKPDDLIISFGYRKIIPKKILSKHKTPIINLHLSYLPFNRGAHPIYWSLVEKTPMGVTIHEINSGIDSGKIIFQKKIRYKINKNTNFKDIYNFMFYELENLFIKNFDKILHQKYKTKYNDINKGTFHNSNQLKKIRWETPILYYLKKISDSKIG